jgi:hypothetical protein
MSGRLVVELTPDALRCARLSSWREQVLESFDIPWDATHPATAIAALATRVPSADGIWVAVHPELLLRAPADLPPAPDEARESMLALEPDRYFATTDRVHIGLAPGARIAFAASATWLDEVIRRLGEVAPVMRVEPSPIAMTALVRTGDVTCEGYSVSIADGTLTGITRRPGQRAAEGPPAALGVLRHDDAAPLGTLMPSEQRQSARRRTMRGVATALLAAAAAIAFFAVSADRARERVLLLLTREADSLATMVQPAVEAQQRLSARARGSELARASRESRADPAGALAAVSTLLPRDVVVLNARVSAGAWQLDGTARDAAALVRVLDADPRFDNVRSLGPSTRFRDGRVARESFSIAFDVRTSAAPE